MSFAGALREVVWPRRGIAGHLGHALLVPLSALFGAGVAVRNLGYRVGILHSSDPGIPVVSVGNLAVGGTGKTPFTLWLASSLRERGWRVAIVLRGYGARVEEPTVVSRGDGPQFLPSEVGDEAVMLARRFRGVVIASPRRIEGARKAAELGCDGVVLDDGFQHRAIARACDIVLIDERRGSLLPAGPMRERPQALRRADALVYVDKSGEGGPTGLVELPEAEDKPLFTMRLRPESLVQSGASLWTERPLSDLAGRRVVAVSGIGQPRAFYDFLRQWEAQVSEVFEFDDHHEYTPGDWQEIVRRSQAADLVVTTEKDLVKLESFPFATGKLVALRVEPVVDRADELVAMVIERARLARGENNSVARNA